MRKKMAKPSKKKAMGCGGKVHKMAKGGGVKVRGCGAATKGTIARGPMA